MDERHALKNRLEKNYICDKLDIKPIEEEMRETRL